MSAVFHYMLKGTSLVGRWEQCQVWQQKGSGGNPTGSRTVRPMAERAVALLDARLAPTHAQVSSSDSSAKAGFALATAPGKYVLHVRPVRTSSRGWWRPA